MTLLGPFCLQDITASNTAEIFRDAVGSLLGTAGIVTAGDLALTQKGTPNMSVEMAAGQVWVKGTTAGSGLYYSRNTAALNIAIPASNVTNPRIETIVIRVKDEAYEGALNEVLAEAVKGTAEAGATLANKKGAGAVPNSSIVVGYVLVPANATTIVTANIETTIGLFSSSVPAVSAWTAVTLGAKLESPVVEAFRTAMVRTENNGATARIRGLVKVKAGETLATGETLMTLPVGFRPAEQLVIRVHSNVAEASPFNVLVSTAGVVTWGGVASVAAGTIFNFEGPFTFSLT